LKSCEYGGVSPDRWLWDFILCSLMEDLEEEELYKRSPDRDAFAKLVCLVLSGNTKDETCILMTRELAKKGCWMSTLWRTPISKQSKKLFDPEGTGRKEPSSSSR
jgi:endonuclease III